MAKYIVSAYEVTEGYLEIEADSVEEAIQKAHAIPNHDLMSLMRDKDTFYHVDSDVEEA